MYADDYGQFEPFMDPLIREYHRAPPDAIHVSVWSLGSLYDLTTLGLGHLSMRVRVARNLKNFPLQGAMTKQQRCDMEDLMVTAFEQLIARPEYGGQYMSMTPGHLTWSTGMRATKSPNSCL
jgi:hypothetical protein